MTEKRTESNAAIFTQQAMKSSEMRDLSWGKAAVFSTANPTGDSPNEDAAALIEVDHDRAVLAVADGVGGLPAGQTASEIALRTLRDELTARETTDETHRATILDALERANNAVVELGIGAGTTVVVTEIIGTTVRPYHVGDSMILIVGQRGKKRHVTLPHSPVGYALHAGVLDEAEAMHHEDRHLVSNLLGTPEMWIDVGSPVHMKKRDTLLLASDGLFDNLHLGEIIDIVRKGPLGLAADRLAEAARLRMTERIEGQPSKPDDLTFILFRRT